MTDRRSATRWRAPTAPCLNCDDPTPGRFCPSCGQRKVDVQVSVRALVADVVEDQFVVNRALPRTLAALLLRPGFLTAEYLQGRIVRYIPPFRLYLVASVLFFLLASFVGLQAVDRITPGTDRGAEHPDSLRLELQARYAALATTDTLELPAGVRRIVQQVLVNTAEALRTLEDTAVIRDSASLAAIRTLADQTVAPGTLQQWAREIRVRSRSPAVQRALDRKLAQVGHLEPRQALRALVSDLLEYAPHMVFLLLPVFALLLKALYVRRGRYYAEHFVFALHVHAFFFIIAIIMFLLPWGGVNGLLLLWMIAYTWLAMRRVYRQGWLRTTAKWALLGWSYTMVFMFGVIGLMFATLLLT
jgi:hypothetical protein